MSDVKTTLTWLLRDQVSGTAKRINGELDKLGLKAKTGGKNIGGLGSALGGIINPTTLAIGALGGLALGIGDVIQGAIEEEKISARLDTALKNNVKGWDGNRTAIDAFVDSQVKLGFVDDDVTAGMAKLVAATGDVNQSMAILRTAEDLSRLTGEDLATSVDALTKVDAGSLRILKSIGIELPKNATATDALAAVQQRAAGQADSYGKTTAGALSKINAEMDQASDKIGKELLPAFAALAGFLADVVIPAITAVIDTVSTLIKKIQDAIDWIHTLTKAQDEKFIPPDSKLGQFFKANLPGKASGGPVQAGAAYTVGENGPETLVMGGSGGTILPAGAGGSGFTIQGVSAGQIADMVDREMYFKLSRSSPSASRK